MDETQRTGTDWNKESTVYEPVKSEEVPDQSRRVYCPDHECWLIQDAYGNWICVVCLVEDRLNL